MSQLHYIAAKRTTIENDWYIIDHEREALMKATTIPLRYIRQPAGRNTIITNTQSVIHIYEIYLPPNTESIQTSDKKQCTDHRTNIQNYFNPIATYNEGDDEPPTTSTEPEHEIRNNKKQITIQNCIHSTVNLLKAHNQRVYWRSKVTNEEKTGTTTLIDKEKGLFSILFEDNTTLHIGFNDLLKFKLTQNDTQDTENGTSQTHTTPVKEPVNPNQRISGYTYNMKAFSSNWQDLHTIAQENPAYILIQETHITTHDENTRKVKMAIPKDYKAYFGSQDPQTRKHYIAGVNIFAKQPKGGICTLLRKDIALLSKPTIHPVQNDLRPYIHHLQINTLSNIIHNIINVYIPPDDMKLANRIWDTIQTITTNAKRDHQAITIAGDFNTNVSNKKRNKCNTLKHLTIVNITQANLTKADTTDKQDTYKSYDLRFTRRLDEWFIGGNQQWVEAIRKETISTEPTPHLLCGSDHIPLRITSHPHFVCIYNPEYNTSANKKYQKTRAELPMTTEDLKNYWNKAKNIINTTDIRHLLLQIKECGQSTCTQRKPQKGTKSPPLNRRLRKIKQLTLGKIMSIQSTVSQIQRKINNNPQLPLDKIEKAQKLSRELNINLIKPNTTTP